MNVGSLLSIHIIKTSSSRLASIRKAKATSSLIFQRQTIKYRRTSSAVKQGPRLSSRSPSFSMASPHPHFEVAASNEELQDGLNETLSQLGELSLRVDETGRAMGKEIEEQSQRVTRPNLGTSTPSDRESRAENAVARAEAASSAAADVAEASNVAASVPALTLSAPVAAAPPSPHPPAQHAPSAEATASGASSSSSYIEPNLHRATYLTYDAANPPVPSFGEHTARFVLISDTHGTCPDVPDGDVLLHAGDWTDFGSTAAIEQQIDWIRSRPHPKKIIIGGNHDWGADSRRGWYAERGQDMHLRRRIAVVDTEHIQAILTSREDGLVYLDDEAYELELKKGGTERTLKIWGSPWSPMYGDWAWNYSKAQAQGILSKIPSDVDILLTHGPPHLLGGLDVVHSGQQVGCQELRRRLQEGEIKPRIHVFGHIHEARGAWACSWAGTRPSEESASVSAQTVFANAAMVVSDAATFYTTGRVGYKVKNQAIIVDLDLRFSAS